MSVMGSSSGPLCAGFFVDEGGGITELLEDGGEGWAVLDSGLGFDADLVARDVGRLVARALVSDGPNYAVVAQAEKLTLGSEVAGRGVVEGVVLEGAGSVRGGSLAEGGGTEGRLDRIRGV